MVISGLLEFGLGVDLLSEHGYDEASEGRITLIRGTRMAAEIVFMFVELLLPFGFLGRVG